MLLINMVIRLQMARATYALCLWLGYKGSRVSLLFDACGEQRGNREMWILLTYKRHEPWWYRGREWQEKAKFNWNKHDCQQLNRDDNHTSTSTSVNCQGLSGDCVEHLSVQSLYAEMPFSIDPKHFLQTNSWHSYYKNICYELSIVLGSYCIFHWLHLHLTHCAHFLARKCNICGHYYRETQYLTPV